MPELSLESPWLLLAALPLFAALAWAVWRTRSPLRPTRQALGGTALLLALSALLLAAAGPSWHATTDRRIVWVLLDRSLSVGDAAERRLPIVLEELKHSLAPQDAVGIIEFAGQARLLLPPTPTSLIDPELELPAAAPSDETWLARALELAARVNPPGSAPLALLLGDGHDSATRYGGDVSSEAAAIGIPLYSIPLDSEPAPEAAIVDFDARLAGEADQMLAVYLDLHSTVAQRVQVALRVNGQAIEVRDASRRLDAGGAMRVGEGRTPLRLTAELPRADPVYQVEVALGAERDTYPGNNHARLDVRGQGEGRVLLLHGRSGRQQALERALRRGGLSLTSGPAAILPANLHESGAYQAVLLCDVPMTDFTNAQLSDLRRFVRDGGSLAMIGGPDSFAPGGWFDTPVEEVLPVNSYLTEPDEGVHAVVVVFDRSGSMAARVGGSSKMELANEGAARTIGLLPPGSMFGMLSVDTQPEWIVPLGPLRDRRAAMALARSNEVGGGGIYVDIAMQETLEHLLRVQASSRHIILFSDGADTERQNGVLEKMQEMHRVHGITVSAICLGDGKDREFLEQLARVGHGRFFFVNDASELPAVFSREAAEAGAAFIREQPFQPVAGLPSRLTQGVQFDSPLLGYVGTSPKEGASVLLWADEDMKYPLLATWHVGLGRALAFTSDARDRWADLWLDWDAFAELWQRWVRWLLPPPGQLPGVEAEWSTRRTGPVLSLTIYGEDGEPSALNQPAAEVQLPDGRVGPASVLAEGTGRYRVSLPGVGTGVYAVAVSQAGADGTPALVARRHFILAPVEELIRRPADQGALRTIGDATGGGIVSSARELASAPVSGGTRVQHARHWLLALALGAMLLALASRRFPSVWRRRDEPAPPLVAAEQTAAGAYSRVVRRRMQQERHAPASLKVGIQPSKPEPERETVEGSLLSAMRKVRKELKKEEQE